MAKDGTSRGGARAGAGRKKKSLSESIIDGQKRSPSQRAAAETSVNMPAPKEFLSAEQKNNAALDAVQVYSDTWRYICRCGCEQLVSTQLIEDYAMSVARWIQCENAISTTGLLGQHPTTGAPIASPYVTMGQNYMKQINQAWYAIYQIVRDNSADRGASPQDELMERLLSAPKRSSKQ